MGKLSCLSVNDGDIEITFDNQNAAECIRAKRIITDMLGRGYALLVKLEDGTYTRVQKFIEKHGTYIIADFDPATDEPKRYGQTENKAETQTQESEPTIKKKYAGRGRKPKTQGLQMEKSEVVAVAPSAGG